MKRPNWIDWQIYRLFYWWWNPILRERPELARMIEASITKYLEGLDYDRRDRL